MFRGLSFDQALYSTWAATAVGLPGSSDCGNCIVSFTLADRSAVVTDALASGVVSAPEELPAPRRSLLTINLLRKSGGATCSFTTAGGTVGCGGSLSPYRKVSPRPTDFPPESSTCATTL